MKRETELRLCRHPTFVKPVRDGPPASVLLYVIRLIEVLHSRKRAMREAKITADRLTAFSDALFAVIVTIMVLALRAPDQPAFSALWPTWPTAIRDAVSYCSSPLLG